MTKMMRMTRKITMRKMRNEKDDKNDMDDTNSNDEKDDKDDKNDLVTSGWSLQHVAWLPNKAAGIGGWGLGVWIFGGHKVGSMAKQTYPGIQVPFNHTNQIVWNQDPSKCSDLSSFCILMWISWGIPPATVHQILKQCQTSRTSPVCASTCCHDGARRLWMGLLNERQLCYGITLRIGAC